MFSHDFIFICYLYKALDCHRPDLFRDLAQHAFLPPLNLTSILATNKSEVYEILIKFLNVSKLSF